MKKSILLTAAFAFVLVLGAALLASPQPARAIYFTPTPLPTDIPTPIPTVISAPQLPGVADGDWVWDDESVSGSETPVDLSQAPAPQWQDVMSWDALVIDGAAEICHPFRGGQLGWVPSIAVLTGKSWTALPTTLQWMPDEEGQLYACAQAPSAGTYVLFGGYVRPFREAPQPDKLPDKLPA